MLNASGTFQGRIPRKTVRRFPYATRVGYHSCPTWFSAPTAAPKKLQRLKRYVVSAARLFNQLSFSVPSVVKESNEISFSATHDKFTGGRE